MLIISASDERLGDQVPNHYGHRVIHKQDANNAADELAHKQTELTGDFRAEQLEDERQRIKRES